MHPNDLGEHIKGNEYFKVPKHTPVSISEIAGRTVCRLLVRDTAGESESTFLNDNVPSWVTDVVVERVPPKFIKIPFYLLPHPQMTKQDRMKKDRLVANEFIQCRKVCDHVLDKVLGAETTPGSGIASNSQSDANSEGSLVPPEDKIELLCNDEVSKTRLRRTIAHHTDCLLNFTDFGPQHGPANSPPLYLETIGRSNNSLQDKTKFQLSPTLSLMHTYTHSNTFRA